MSSSGEIDCPPGLSLGHSNDSTLNPVPICGLPIRLGYTKFQSENDSFCKSTFIISNNFGKCYKTKTLVGPD